MGPGSIEWLFRDERRQAAPAGDVKKRLLGLRMVDPVDECWLWQGNFNSDGYGTISLPNSWLDRFPEVANVQQVAWYIWRGYKANRLKVLCKRKLCFNPSHLEDMRAGSISPAQISAVHTLHASGLKPAAIKGILGLTIDVRTVRDICDGKYHRLPSRQ